MKMTTIKRVGATCALLLLAGCGGTGTIGIVSRDSSPIIISDGSVHVNQPDHFRVHGAKKATVRLGNHKPTYLGYQCDPEDGSCKTACDAANVQPACQIKLTDLTNWTLKLSDTTSVAATLTWDNGTKERIKIELPKDLTFQDGAAGSVDLVPSNHPLKSATFTGGYTFACSPNATCLTIGYVCTSGCTPP